MRKLEKGDWHWIEKTCGVILPRVHFREIVYFCQNSLILGFFVKTSSDDGVGHSWQGFFFSEITRPWISGGIFWCFGIKILSNP